MRRVSFFILSWIVVAFGQPSWIPYLAPLAATLGFALFWKELVGMESKKSRFAIATLWYVGVQAIQLSWMTATEFQGIYILGVYAALCLWLGLQFGLLSLFVNKIPHAAVAALWTLMEWTRLFVFCGFSWNPVGLSLTSFTVSTQMASIFGVLGLSFLVIVTNLAALQRKWAVWSALALFPYLFGLGHLAYHQKGYEESPSLSVALVQTGLLPSQKIPMAGREAEFIPPFDQWKRILNALKEKKQQFDLVVLPESVVPIAAESEVYPMDTTRYILEDVMGQNSDQVIASAIEKQAVSNTFWMQAIATLFSSEVIAGLDAHENGKYYASAYHVFPQKLDKLRYEKQILLPLAEYLPFQWLRDFTKRYGITEFFTHGTETKVFPGKVPLSISICYEETFAHAMREGRKKGAELFVNVTNDNWYYPSKLPEQHFDHGRIRAVENGVPLVRACNSGMTAAVDSLGRTVALITDHTKAAVLAAHVPTYHYKTLYTFWGDFGIIFFCLGLLVLTLISSRKSLLLFKIAK